MGLRDLQEWHDWDGAAYVLGGDLGLWDSTDPCFGNAKHIFWTDNPIGNALHNFLEELVRAGVLEGDGEGQTEGHYSAFRWNKDFKGTWEKKKTRAGSSDGEEDDL